SEPAAQPGAPAAEPPSATRSAPPPAQAAPGAAVPPRVPVETVTEVDPIDIPPDPDPQPHAWDRPEARAGLYPRASVALGLHSTRFGPARWEGDDGSEARGFGTGFGLDSGGFLAPWIALHLDTSVGIMWNGDVDYDYGRYDDDDDARVVSFGFAPA